LEVEKVKIYYDQVGKSLIHSIDIGLRGFAITKDNKFASPMDSAIVWKDSILHCVETPLRKLNYNLREYTIFKDSLEAYFRYCLHLKELLLQKREDDFKAIFASDKGAHLWWQYIGSEQSITTYVNQIDAGAQKKYERALLSNQILQLFLFLICFPTLLFTAFYTLKTIKLSDLLRVAEEDKNSFLQGQNAMLEFGVTERTQEITTQNEEIVAQREELSRQWEIQAIQNKELQKAQEIIENQNAEIQSMNDHLQTEVNNRTRELNHANQELIEQNSQLEQFGFIAGHNLRAPLARILGLTNLLTISLEAEKGMILEKLLWSAKDLDQVIQDLTSILNIKKHTSNLVQVDLKKSFDLVKRTLEKEIEKSQAVVRADFSPSEMVFAVELYVKSILYNLISNAVKYRDPERPVSIVVATAIEKDFVRLSVTDNGLGIDLSRYKQSLFGLYKRFHTHMEGRGLGLYLVKTQIEALGGKVDVISELNKGTTFFVYFRKQA
jgi:signal transduction histidine kinase